MVPPGVRRTHRSSAPSTWSCRWFDGCHVFVTFFCTASRREEYRWVTRTGNCIVQKLSNGGQQYAPNVNHILFSTFPTFSSCCSQFTSVDVARNHFEGSVTHSLRSRPGAHCLRLTYVQPPTQLPYTATRVGEIVPALPTACATLAPTGND